MNLRELQDNWDSMGRRALFTAILTIKMSWSGDDFFETGRQEISGLVRDMDSLGRLTQPLADHYEEVVGVDIARSMIKLAEKLNRRGSRCSYVLNERDDLSVFGNGGFVLINSNITLQHMELRYAFSVEKR
jgi:hypothetical protein